MLRLDPFSLPVRFAAGDARADDQVRFVEVHRERVVMRRAVAGIPMAVSLPVTMYLGVAIRIVPPTEGNDGAIAVVLEHRDQALSVPLFFAPEATDILAEWQSWARVLGLPLLVHDGEGAFSEPFARMGAVRITKASPRRRRQTAMRSRRPRMLMRRKPGRPASQPTVFRGEREIIARN